MKQQICPNRLWKDLLTFACLLCGIMLIVQQGQLGFDNPTGMLKDDRRSIAYLFLSLGLLAILTNLTALRAVFWILILASSALIAANWTYFDFYRTFIDPSLMKFGISSLDGLRSMRFEGKTLTGSMALTAGLALLALGFYVSIKSKFGQTAAAIFTLAGCYFGATYQLEVSNNRLPWPIHDGRLYEHPVGFFLRGPVSSIPESVTPEQIAAIKSFKQSEIVGPPNFPLAQSAANPSPKNTHQNVIVVLLESVRTAEGFFAGNTPFLKTLAQQDNITYFDQFYANSTQTIRAEIATLCGVIDPFPGAPYSLSGRPNTANCLPDILKRHNYKNFWFHGYDKTFFNRDEFLPQIGFDTLFDREAMLNQNGEINNLGWGVSDVESGHFVMQTLAQAQQPFFAEWLTLSNHYPFAWEWEKSELGEELGRSTGKIYKDYLKGLKYTDFAIQTFWKNFSESNLYHNTIVIFVGDHGVWLFDNELEQQIPDTIKHEIYFRVPLLVYTPDGLKQPHTQPASQIDIAPTILSMLDLEHSGGFLGIDLTSTENSQLKRPILTNKLASSGIRQGHTYCYPKEIQCDNSTGPAAYQICPDSKTIRPKDASSSTCYVVQKDLLDIYTKTSGQNIDESLYSLEAAPHLIKQADSIIDYMKYGWQNGFSIRSAKRPTNDEPATELNN